MRKTKAARDCCSSPRAKSVGLTDSIVSNEQAFRLVAGTVGFTALMLAIPTIMALMKCWGWW